MALLFSYLSMNIFYQSYSLHRISKVKPLRDFCNYLLDNRDENLLFFEDELNKLISSNFLTELVNVELSQMINQNLYSPVPAAFNHFTIFDSKNFSFFIYRRKMEDEKVAKYCSPHSANRFIIPLNNNGMYADLYRQENPYPLDILATNKKMEIVKKNKHYKKNELIFLEKHKDIFSFNNYNAQDILFLNLYQKPEEQYVWEYNIETREPEKIVACNSQSSARLEQTCTLIGELGHEKSLPFLKTLLVHPEFNVRWESVKAIMLIDFDEGIKSLNLLKNDSHPEIIKAVEKSMLELKQLNLI